MVHLPCVYRLLPPPAGTTSASEAGKPGASFCPVLPALLRGVLADGPSIVVNSKKIAFFLGVCEGEGRGSYFWGPHTLDWGSDVSSVCDPTLDEHDCDRGW